MDKEFGGGLPEKLSSSNDIIDDLKGNINTTNNNEDNEVKEDTTMIHPSSMPNTLSTSSNASPTATGGGSSSNKSSGDPNHFPTHLYKMLEEIQNCQGYAAEKVQEGEGGTAFSSIVSWQPHGKCFLIHDEDMFSKYVLPKYFCRLKFTSFQRQLHFHGFKRLCKQGPDKGAYYHDLFARGMPEVATYIQRIKSSKGLRGRKRKSQDQEPDFYKQQQQSSSPTVPAMMAAAAASASAATNTTASGGGVSPPATPVSAPKVSLPATTNVTTNQAPLPSLVGDEITADMVRLEPTPIGQMRTVLQGGVGQPSMQIPAFADFQESMNRMPATSSMNAPTTSSASPPPNKRQRVQPPPPQQQQQQHCNPSSSPTLAAASDNESKFLNSSNNRLDMAAVQMILQQQQQRGGGGAGSLRDASSTSPSLGGLQQQQQNMLMPHMNTSTGSSSLRNDHDDTLFQLGIFCGSSSNSGSNQLERVGSGNVANPTTSLLGRQQQQQQQQQPLPSNTNSMSLQHLSLDLELEPAPIRFPPGQQQRQQEQESTLHPQQQSQEHQQLGQYEAEDQLQQHILRQIDEQQRQLRQQRQNILQRQQLQLQQRQMNAMFQDPQPFGSTTNESGRQDQQNQQQQQQPLQRLLQQQPLGFDDQLLPFPGFQQHQQQQQQEDDEQHLATRLGNYNRHLQDQSSSPDGSSPPQQNQMQRFPKHSG